MDDSTAVVVQGRIRRSTAVQAAADFLREEILAQLPYTDEQEWLLGSEDEVLERLGVSRPTVRQAVRLLEAEQLLVVRRGHRGGIWARVPSSDGVVHAVSVYLRSQGATVLDLSEAVCVIAPRCMALAAENPDDAARNVLDNLANELDRAADDPGGARRFAQLRLAFLQQVAALAKNPVMKLYFNIANDLIAAARQPLYLDPEERKQAMRFYRHGARAIITGDSAKAQRVARVFFGDLHDWLRRETAKHGADWLPIR